MVWVAAGVAGSVPVGVDVDPRSTESPPAVGSGAAAAGVEEGSGTSVGGGVGVGLVAAVATANVGTPVGRAVGLGSASAWTQPSSSRGTAASQIIMEAGTPFPLTFSKTGTSYWIESHII